MTTAIAPWIQTLSGRAFDFVDMTANVWDEKEVATVLSRLPRFNGHSRWFYSVAQHSVLVARQCYGRRLKLPALLHDAPEAIIGDVSAPLKAYLEIGSRGLKELEADIWNWVADVHEFAPESIEEIKHEDWRALATEARDLMALKPRPWCPLPPPWEERIEPWCPEYARDEWLEMYYGLLETPT